MTNEEITQDQLDYIESLPAKYLAKVTDEINKPAFEAALAKTYDMVKHPAPKVLYFDSPRAMQVHISRIYGLQSLDESELEKATAAIQDELAMSSFHDAEVLAQGYLDSLLESPSGRGLSSKYRLIQEVFDKIIEDKGSYDSNGCAKAYADYFYTYWMAGSVAFADAAKYLGHQIDPEAVELLRDLGQPVGYILPYAEYCLVSHNPITANWKDGELHCSNNPAVEYRDGFKVWSLDGVLVNQQIVMAPHTLTMKQIDSYRGDLHEKAIEQFGYTRYLEGKGAVVTDVNLTEDDGVFNVEYSILVPSTGVKMKCTCGALSSSVMHFEVGELVKTAELLEDCVFTTLGGSEDA